MDRHKAIPITAVPSDDRRLTFARDPVVVKRVVELHRSAQVEKPAMHSLVIVADLHDENGRQAAALADPSLDKTGCDWWAWLVDRQQWNLARNNEIPGTYEFPFIVISGPTPLICGAGLHQSPKP